MERYAVLFCLLSVGCNATREAPCSNGDTQPCAVRLPGSEEAISCMQGTQTCVAGTWGACTPNGTIVSLRPQSGPSVCDDPCNPACRYFGPDDGGVNAPFTPGGSYQGGAVPLSSLPNGWTKVNRSPCSGPADCEFDSKCVNGTCTLFSPGESGSCNGVDLTVQSACESNNGTLFPVCNRGTTIANAGSVKIGFDMDPPPSGTCAPASGGGYPGKGSCTIDLTKIAIAPGKCVDINPEVFQNGVSCNGNVNVSGNRDAFINYDGALAECNKCNNEGMKKAGTSCSNISASTYQPTSVTQQYTAVCPQGKLPQWSALAWVATVPNGTKVTFTGRLGVNGTWTTAQKLGDTSTGDPATCGMFGPSPCPKDLQAAFGKISRPVLELTVSLTPTGDGSAAPNVSTWQVTYNCVDSL